MASLPRELIGEFVDAVIQDRDRAKYLLSVHPQLINARWIYNETVLHFLAVEGFIDGVRFLAECGADVNIENEFGDTALIDVTVLGNVEVAHILLSHGANPNANSETRNNPLDCAVRSGSVRLVGLLLEAGADGRYVTDLGESVFDALPASADERDGIVALLSQHGITSRAG
jgi:ankyrin repeat protein